MKIFTSRQIMDYCFVDKCSPSETTRRRYDDKWVSVTDLKLFLQKGANADWEAEVLEKEVLKHNVSCNNICNIASDLRYKLNQLFKKLGGHI